MTLGVLLFVAFRIATSLPVLRWPLAGGLLAVAADLGDLLVKDLVAQGDLGALPDYQLLDKLLDQVYLALFLVVSLRWSGVERNVSVALYAYRLVGAALFVATGDRLVLFLFPNVFEPWFLLVAALHHRREPVGWTVPLLAAVLLALTALKLVQEWALHVGQLFEDLTSLEFLDSLWRAIGGGR